MTEKRPPDAVDKILQQWNVERPDLDVTPMGSIGRLKRCAALMQRRLDATFSQFDMTGWEFDVLATLRRSGKPYCLAPTALFSTLMITSGAMTHRLQRLEASGLIERTANKEDARSKLVQLTPKGLELIDRAVDAHVQNEHNILQPLNPEERQQLDECMRRLLRLLEGEG
ncbi:Transcriptional regulator [Hahella chejuensis KCTC 2396]|uniref:Transcriptional regulator n=1 Tax=Hahella chejuensis (strain KCTC 2396) TaxID=349521 RepID=Q2SG97_HAHCH|nr:MarR family transcriptional regulator [Hahella chejuensis]ABC30327.1 Transcriptional regulator [Hahella chejuensis KCTC 2396]